MRGFAIFLTLLDLPWLWRGYAAAASFALIITVPLGIELGQVLLPEKRL